MDIKQNSPLPSSLNLSTLLLSFCLSVWGCEGEPPAKPTLPLVENTAPEWPADAALVVSELSDRSARLSWPRAIDDHGVVSYELSQEGEVLTRLTGDAYSLQLSTLEPMTQYQIAIIYCCGWCLYSMLYSLYKTRGSQTSLSRSSFGNCRAFHTQRFMVVTCCSIQYYSAVGHQSTYSAHNTNCKVLLATAYFIIVD